MTDAQALPGAEPGRQPDEPAPARRRSPVAQRAAREVRDALRPFTIPNGITLVRLALVPFFILAVVEGNFALALGIFLVAGLSDGLDGWLARSLGMRSLLGSYLDPIADKALLVAAFVTLTWPQPGMVRIPVWLTVLALSRDFLIVLTALVLYLGADVRAFPPSMWGKSTTVAHIVTVALVLVANVWPVREVILLVCFYLALGLTLVSGVDYIRRASLLMEEMHGDRQPPEP
ncbi:MAG: CDP-alcohol phosphatidyltransferase family protein [Thermoanaerobaculaceae bacterium]|nr:CDP-alcohol phosphatidyltransferase family protein [Thermoanaerobaculaceae bacterium]